MEEHEEFQFDERLLTSIRRGWNITVKSILNKNLDLAKKTDDFGTLLHYAAKYNNEEIAWHLIQVGSEVDSLGLIGRTPLMIAVQSGHVDVVKVLLKADANINFANVDGKTALQIAIHWGTFDSSIVEMFTREVQIKTRSTSEIAETAKKLICGGCNMYHVVILRDTKLMKCMLDFGIDIDSRGANRRTALHVAADMNDSELAIWLIKNGADVNALDHCGNSALLLFAKKANRDMIKILLDQGADPNCKNLYGDIPFIALFTNSNKLNETEVECVKLLFSCIAIPQTSEYRLLYNLFDCALNSSSVDTFKMLIGQLVVFEMMDKTRVKSVIYDCGEGYESEIKWAIEKFYELCQFFLTISMSENSSLFDLLTDNDYKMRIRVRNETLISNVEMICNKYNLSKILPYYHNRLMNRIAKAIREVKLEDQAIEVVCTIFRENYNQCYNIARHIVAYLNECDLKNLIRVSDSRDVSKNNIPQLKNKYKFLRHHL